MTTGFSLLRTQPVAALNLTVEEYEHRSGARHYHLANDYEENVFMVALRTVPEDSRGAAHILEHTALCGSEKFPVRDPFFSMIRRSLNTFMNAFTTSDYTAYPFASQNCKDYFNLMEVYLDAVFFSRLDPRDFAQEGHRVELEDASDPLSPLVYKGVVYNEMKGDSSSVVSRLYHAIQAKLYPTSTYHFNSGGDPSDIPDLSYEDLIDFYRTHYHPSNAVFMTFGNISATEQQEKMAEFALDRIEPTEVPEIRVRAEQRYSEPVNAEFHYPLDDDDLAGKTHIVMAWLLGQNTDLKMLLKGHLLSDVLLDTSASPLRLALEKTDLATGVSPMCGFEEDHMEMNFMAGVEGSEEDRADDVEALIFETLARIAAEGVPVDRLEAVLHQLELSQREVGGDGMPYGLQLIFGCMSAAVHRGDPIALLDIEGPLAELRDEIREPYFIGQLIQELLLDNPHRVRVVMSPSREYGHELVQVERQKLEALKAAMTEGELKRVVDQANELKIRQDTEENLEILPRVTVADVPAAKSFPVVQFADRHGLKVCAMAAGTNGLSYHQIIRPLSGLSGDQIDYLPVYSQIVPEVGSAGRDYLETQHLQHSHTGGISCFSVLRTDLSDLDRFHGHMTLSSRTLNPKSGAMMQLLFDTSQAPRFDESERIRDLVQRLALRRVNSIAANGHQYAMAAAAHKFRAVTALNNHLTGIPGIRRLKQLADSLDDPGAALAFSEHLSTLHAKLCSPSPYLLLISDAGHLQALKDEVTGLWQARGHDPVAPLVVPETGVTDTAYIVTTQVNYCAAAYATVAESDPDAVALSILAGVLRNNFLHPMIREKGGAYGGGASHDNTNGVFRFYSYRDPRLQETFDDFSAAIEGLLRTEITDSMLEESTLGVISSIDSPGSPAGEIRQAFHHDLYGRSSAHREAMRKRYLEVRQADLKRVAEQYLRGQPSIAVVTSQEHLAEVEGRFNIIRVND